MAIPYNEEGGTIFFLHARYGSLKNAIVICLPEEMAHYPIGVSDSATGIIPP